MLVPIIIKLIKRLYLVFSNDIRQTYRELIAACVHSMDSSACILTSCEQELTFFEVFPWQISQ